MGYGIPAAVGVQVAHPGALGGSILPAKFCSETMQEISTAVQYRCRSKKFILNNEYMGMVANGRNCCMAGAIRAAIQKRCPISSNWPRLMVPPAFVPKSRRTG
ncbi:MAG: hypothetical protein CM15mP21_0500 [Hyphomicrobiales bacterium]|nr:MAG: hypothetical protein CM15mP21_0500 [Hyphomicrobiales bacterium]